MLAKARLVTFLLFLATASYLVYHSVHITSNDQNFYQMMTEQKKNERAPLSYQEKQGVQKCIYFSNDQAREKTVIEAEKSSVKAISRKKGYEFVETLKNIEGSMETAEQRRTFTAHDGTYYYSSSKFISPKAFIKLYKETLFLDGIARDLCIGLSDGKASFNAGQIKANLPNPKELR